MSICLGRFYQRMQSVNWELPSAIVYSSWSSHQCTIWGMVWQFGIKSRIPYLRRIFPWRGDCICSKHCLAIWSNFSSWISYSLCSLCGHSSYSVWIVRALRLFAPWMFHFGTPTATQATNWSPNSSFGRCSWGLWRWLVFQSLCPLFLLSRYTCP